MASQAEIDEPPARRAGRRIGCYAALVVLAILAVGLAVLWLNRERIADNVIADELESLGIEASYEIERIGGRRQVLTDIVIGDPARPDLTIERAEVVIRHRLGFPAIAAVRLTRPRLYGTYRNGTLSFGTLDPLLFTGEEKPFELPDFVLAVTDGRALRRAASAAILSAPIPASPRPLIWRSAPGSASSTAASEPNRASSALASGWVSPRAWAPNSRYSSTS